MLKFACHCAGLTNPKPSDQFSPAVATMRADASTQSASLDHTSSVNPASDTPTAASTGTLKVPLREDVAEVVVMLSDKEEINEQLVEWAEHGDLAKPPLMLQCSDVDWDFKLRALRQQHLPAIDYLHSVDLFEVGCWGMFDHILEGLQAGMQGTSINSAQQACIALMQISLCSRGCCHTDSDSYV